VGQAFPLLLAAAVTAGLIWLGRQPEMRMEAGLMVLAGGLIGGRLGFAALHAPYFTTHLVEIAWLWQGGLSWVGAVAGAALAAAAAAWLTGTQARALADALSVPMSVVALASWTGCLVDACGFGHPVASSWAPLAYDSFGVLARRWPTQAVGMIASGALLAALVRREGWPLPAGALGMGTMAVVAGSTTLLSLTRGDPSLLIGRWRVDTVAGGVVFLAAALTTAALVAQRRVPESDS